MTRKETLLFLEKIPRPRKFRGTRTFLDGFIISSVFDESFQERKFENKSFIPLEKHFVVILKCGVYRLQDGGYDYLVLIKKRFPTHIST